MGVSIPFPSTIVPAFPHVPQLRSSLNRFFKKNKNIGLPWWSTAENSVLPPQGAIVPSLVGVRFHVPCGQKRNKTAQ